MINVVLKHYYSDRKWICSINWVYWIVK